MSLSEDEQLSDFYKKWKRRPKSADIYMERTQLKVSIEGLESYYPFGKERGPLRTLAYVVALLYETCGVKEIRIHENEEVN